MYIPDQSKSMEYQSGVTILIPHYQTLESIKLCLRCLRKYTSVPCKVRVLDNGSTDASRTYLESVSWIDLVDSGVKNDTWKAHYECLNKAVAEVDTPYFLIMHSDTYVLHHGWLPYLISQLNSRWYAAVGSHDQAIPIAGPWRWLRGYHNRNIREFMPGVPIIRSLCTLYRTTAFRQSKCSFGTSSSYEDITYAPHMQLVQDGRTILPLPASTLCKYMFHSSATTRISNGTYMRDPSKHLRKHARFRKLPRIQAILRDASLDQRVVTASSHIHVMPQAVANGSAHRQLSTSLAG